MIENTAPLNALFEVIKEAKSKGRKIHFVTPYRGETYIQMEKLLGMPVAEIKNNAIGRIDQRYC